MAALGNFRPGTYTATFGGVACGLTTGEGFRLRWKPKAIKINNTGAYGDTLIDGIYRGVGDVQIVTTFKEWNVTIGKMIWPWGAGSPPAFDGTLGVIGTLHTSKALPLILTPGANTPAAANGPSNGVFTAGMARIADENDIDWLNGPVETDIPVVLDLLLYDDSGTKRFFAWS